MPLDPPGAFPGTNPLLVNWLNSLPDLLLGRMTDQPVTLAAGLTVLGGLTSSGGVTSSGSLVVPSGGTGSSTLTLHGVLYGNSSSPVGVTAAGSSNTVLVTAAGNAAPTFSATPTLTTLTTTSGLTVGSSLVVGAGMSTSSGLTVGTGYSVNGVLGLGQVTNGRVTGQTAAASSVASLTVGTSDASYYVSGNVNVTASVTHNFTLQLSYTDETNAGRTVTMSVQQVGGTIITAITNVTGVGAYEGVPLHIRAKAGTAITVLTAGTFTSVTYNVEGHIAQIA